MFLLAKLQLLLAGSDKVIVELARKGEQLELVVIPKLANLKPDTDDAVVATLQAGLALPFRCLIPLDADPDAYVAEQIGQLAQKRAAPLSQLEAYQQELTQAANAAKVAAEQAAVKKAEQTAAKGKGGKTPVKTAGATPVAASTLASGASAGEVEDEAEEGADAASDASSPTTAPEAAPVAAPAAASLSLFDDIEA